MPGGSAIPRLQEIRVAGNPAPAALSDDYRAEPAGQRSWHLLPLRPCVCRAKNDSRRANDPAVLRVPEPDREKSVGQSRRHRFPTSSTIPRVKNCAQPADGPAPLFVEKVHSFQRRAGEGWLCHIDEPAAAKALIETSAGALAACHVAPPSPLRSRPLAPPTTIVPSPVTVIARDCPFPPWRTSVQPLPASGAFMTVPSSHSIHAPDCPPARSLGQQLSGVAPESMPAQIIRLPVTRAIRCFIEAPPPQTEYCRRG